MQDGSMTTRLLPRHENTSIVKQKKLNPRDQVIRLISTRVRERDFRTVIQSILSELRLQLRRVVLVAKWLRGQFLSLTMKMSFGQLTAASTLEILKLCVANH